MRQLGLMLGVSLALATVADAGWHRHGLRGGCYSGPACLGQMASCAAAMPCGSGCGTTCAPAPTCAPAMVEQVVMVPEMTTETRKVMVTQYQTEQKSRTYTIQRQVPRTETRTGTRTVMVPTTKTVE